MRAGRNAPEAGDLDARLTKVPYALPAGPPGDELQRMPLTILSEVGLPAPKSEGKLSCRVPHQGEMPGSFVRSAATDRGEHPRGTIVFFSVGRLLLVWTGQLLGNFFCRHENVPFHSIPLVLRIPEGPSFQRRMPLRSGCRGRGSAHDQELLGGTSEIRFRTEGT